MVNAILDNYGADVAGGDDDQRGEPHHNWVDEVVRCEGRSTAVDASPCSMAARPCPEKKDPALLTR